MIDVEKWVYPPSEGRGDDAHAATWTVFVRNFWES